MRRAVAGGAAIAMAVALVVVGIVAARGGRGEPVDDRPRALPVLGASGVAGAEAATPAADATADSGRVTSAYGGVTYRVEGELADLGGEANAWSVGLGVDDERLARLAEALGVEGSFEQAEGYRVLRDGDHELVVNGEPGAPWSLSRGPTSGVSVGSVGSVGTAVAEPDVVEAAPPVPAPTAITPVECDLVGSEPCPPATTVIVGCDLTTPCEAPAPGIPEPLPEPERPADLPSEEEAESLVRELFAAAGLELDGAAVTTIDAFSVIEVRVDPVVGGLPTVGMTWTGVVGPGGELEYGQGWLGVPEEGDVYPLVGTAAAVERLQAEPQAVPAIAIDCPPDVECPDIEPVERAITDARLALQLVPAFGAEEAFLVPSYLFALDDGSEVPAFAVADDLLTAPPVVETPPAPPVSGGDEPVSSPPSEGSAGGPAPTDAPERLGEAERAVIGQGYYLDISTHCGAVGTEFDGRLWDASPLNNGILIEVLPSTEFDGRLWDASPPLGDGNPPPGWAEPTEGGTMTLLSDTEAEFVGDFARTKVVRFTLRPPEAGPLPGCE